MQYAPEVKTQPGQRDHYKAIGPKTNYVFSPELDMFFPRIHDDKHAQEYIEWLDMKGTTVDATVMVDSEGNTIQTRPSIKPTMAENLRFFISYQLNYMYWRYFMWNFSGRQNDIQGMGEVNHGNWLTGYPFIDNPRLGDQSMLPDDMGKGNKGHNVFYMLPLLMGLFGLLWQAYRGRRGIEQFWVVFFLFFMTGIAIVMYLNQTPSQPRERDYAYAGSFYAFSIWVGMGVAALWSFAMWLMKKSGKQADKKEAGAETTALAGEAPAGSSNGMATAIAGVAALIGILVPLQMVSQTWDDHDRSGRYAARDFGRNYLSSVAPNGVIFCNGDNDTFPLWYLQEVEGYRTDVRAVNLSYLATDWYISQMRRAAYESAPLPMQASDTTYAYDQHVVNYIWQPDMTLTNALTSLADVYAPDNKTSNPFGINMIKYPNVFMPVDADQAIKAGVVKPSQRALIVDSINVNLAQMGQGMTSSQLMSFDIIASSIAEGWNRPCYFAMTVPDSYYLGLQPYLRLTGLAYQVTPIQGPSRGTNVSTDIMYDNVVNNFRWGGLDTAKPGEIYLDETICRMVTTTRSAMMQLASALITEGRMAEDGKYPIPEGMSVEEYAADRYKKAGTILDLMMEKLPVSICPFTVQIGEEVAEIYHQLGESAKDNTYTDKARKILEDEIVHYGQYVRYYQSLSPNQYSQLTRTDKFIDQQYLLDMLADYGEWFGDDDYRTKVVPKLQDMGVSLERQLQFQQQYEAALRQQMQARMQEQAQQQEGGGEVSANLEEMLGN